MENRCQIIFVYLVRRGFRAAFGATAAMVCRSLRGNGLDLGAERATIGAERGGERIAIEIAGFLADSPVRDLQEAVGQFAVYRAVLSQADPERSLFLGVPSRVHDSLLSEPLGQLVAADVRLRVLVFDAQQQKVVRWIR